jgi:hypothetical protein
MVFFALGKVALSRGATIARWGEPRLKGPILMGGVAQELLRFFLKNPKAEQCL